MLGDVARMAELLVEWLQIGLDDVLTAKFGRQVMPLGIEQVARQEHHAVGRGVEDVGLTRMADDPAGQAMTGIEMLADLVARLAQRRKRGRNGIGCPRHHQAGEKSESDASGECFDHGDPERYWRAVPSARCARAARALGLSKCLARADHGAAATVGELEFYVLV